MAKNETAHVDTTNQDGYKYTRTSNVRYGERRSQIRSEERRGERPGKLSHCSMEYTSPLRFIMVIAGSILIAEVTVVFIVSHLQPMSKEAEIPLVVVLTLLPFYLFFIKPLLASIKERESLEDSLYAISLTDELTGLCNRRGLFTFAEHEVKLAKREQSGIALLYADLDNLKGINDTRGHKAGDKAIVDIANILKTTYRHTDIIARLGGDEFVVMPVGTTKDGVDIILDRLQQKLNFYNEERLDYDKLSLSIGSVHHDSGFSYSTNELLVQADQLMYEQKMAKKRSSAKVPPLLHLVH